MWFLGREMLSVGARQGAGPDVILGAVRGKWIVGGKDISRGETACAYTAATKLDTGLAESGS